MIDDYTDDFWIYTEQVDSNIIALNYDSEGKTWIKELTSKDYLKIENLNDKNNIITICGYFNGTLLVNDEVIGESKNSSVFILRYNHDGILQSSNFIENINQGLHSEVLNGKVYLNALVAGSEINLDNATLNEFPNNPIVNIIINEKGKIEKVLGKIGLDIGVKVIKSAISTDGTKSIFLLSGKGSVKTDSKVVYTNTSENILTLLLLNNDGSVLWTKTFNGSIDVEKSCITFDDIDRIFIGLSFEGNLSFQKSTFKSNGQFDIILLQLSSLGDLISSKQYGTTDNENISHFLRDGKGALYFGGNYEGTTQSRIIGNYQFINASKLDMSQAFISYVFERDFDNSGIINKVISNQNILNIDKLIAYPNPFNNNISIEFNVSESQEYEVSLIDISGQTVYRELFSASKGSNKFDIDLLENLSKGMYFVKAKPKQGKTLIDRIIKIE